MSKPTSNNSKKPSASFNKKTRSRLAELAAQKKAKANDLEQKYPVPTEEETKQALMDILQGLGNGLTLQQILGLSDVLLEEIYTIAYSFYSQGKYTEAIGLFQILTASKPQCYKYVLGLSSCYHQLKMYNEAAFGFFLAFDAEPENPIPPYYIADSLMKIDQKEESRDFLDITIDICGNKPEYKILKERCNIMKNSLNTDAPKKNQKTKATKSKTPAKKRSGGKR
ncbi:type III secretion low calcium response chaperone LcrH/SycD [Chlamydia ibidis]|uniref:Type III secretion low calcium response chaperone LcrH/SycD n=2 Tax=Chlamydia ibidis TaxID=1405396 RepID=S7J449_9CHLA|nr:SycD/LcrH family type III secretion system chaperone [Chlamydia ibidis]EPP34772.1 type III secretion low calcium response chaperone LcrH/SycD [Chlamydia ibidis]EQM62248.1 type III secretion low calcium response chaperone LcrH/SycD [Chlamydia ibidis 10-1398/6]